MPWLQVTAFNLLWSPETSGKGDENIQWYIYKSLVEQRKADNTIKLLHFFLCSAPASMALVSVTLV